ncbi:uncharacterized protein A1O9_01839 [Exophiala aquamarina CBS 119918]|uniref:Uncharacterized protein n=1 Tax=Exophiala aquamarina CBS 119918 TaxID=1182545 RepID=A0A072PVH2_9EURO|nr:uncharacterized protein A1O9_01839 [Exophiala aquamarina CBS 119918]KEF63861.1 hypothetical protein A1O9_01839 [Exophiala aquamarina CBS 119918]
MLPLLYFSHKLTVRDDPWYFATWNIMLRPGRSMANCEQCHGQGRGSSLIRRWNIFKDNFWAPVKILKTLYALGRVIGEDPNTIQPTPPPFLNIGPDSAIDVQSVEENTPKVLGNEVTDSSAKAPASASQIYHAALLNGNTLDDILAAFETNTPGSSIRAEHAVVTQSPIISRDNEERLTGPFKRRHYRDASLRSKTQETTFAQISDSSLISSLEPCPVFYGSEVKAVTESPSTSPRSQCQTRSVSSPHAYDAFKEQDENKLAISTESTQCPTYMRRHNHSAGPKRPLSGDRKSLALLQETGTMSSPALSSSSPTRRAKLQRRVKVYKDEERV